MNLSLLIARRYLFSRKQKTVINVISWISLIGIAVSTMALIVVLSVYNGIGNLTQGLFNLFDPELKVEVAEGKSFHLPESDYNALCNMKGVASVAQIVEENAWITHGDHDAIVSLRGVDSIYGPAIGIDTQLYQGTYQLRGTMMMTDPETGLAEPVEANYLVMGGEVHFRLGMHSTDNTPIAIHIPRRGTALGTTIDEAFNNGYALCGAIFFLQQEIDARYVLADIAFVRSLLDYDDNQCTALSLQLDGSRTIAQVKADVQAHLGPQFTVKDRFDQQPLYYKIFRSERLGIILILALIVLISTLNLVASLSLLILDKRHDIGIMHSMGMPSTTIRRAFFAEGVLISVVGIVAGLAIGFIICFMQQQFGIVKMGDNFIVNAFPVDMHTADFLLTLLLVGAISTLAVFLTTRRKGF
ncbi:MAG: FtsX-like permease family protein [Bacteroidales bacterium]|nr:FtsX-like permease family protein [Bacteroidales bacterium]